MDFSAYNEDSTCFENSNICSMSIRLMSTPDI